MVGVHHRRKRVTLIAAIRAEDGIAICADSQETITNSEGHEYRRSVQKITPIDTGGALELSIAGAGDADLIDSFIAVFSRKLKGTNIPNLQVFVDYFEAQLNDFYRVDVPLAGDDKSFILFVVASIPTTREYEVWTSKQARLKPLGKADLIGWDESLYYRSIDRHQGIGVAQAVLTAIHTITIAEETSNCVRSPFVVAVVNDNGIAIEDPSYVDMLRARLVEYEKRLNAVFLACADTSVHKDTLNERLSAFAKEATQLHENYMLQAVQHQVSKLMTGEISGDAYPKIPLGTRISARLTKDGPEIYNSEYKLLDDDKEPEDGPDGGVTK